MAYAVATNIVGLLLVSCLDTATQACISRGRELGNKIDRDVHMVSNRNEAFVVVEVRGVTNYINKENKIKNQPKKPPLLSMSYPHTARLQETSDQANSLVASSWVRYSS